MALGLKTQHYQFDSTAGTTQKETQSVDFGGRRILRDRPGPILQAALVGFDIRYDDGDHHMKQLTIQVVDVDIVPNTGDTEAEATVLFLLRDDSGNIDDPFSGSVDVLFIAEVE